VSHLGRKLALICRTQDCPAPNEQSVQCIAFEDLGLLRFQQTFVPSNDADCLPASTVGRFRYSANDSVQTRAISATGHNSNCLTHIAAHGTTSVTDTASILSQRKTKSYLAIERQLTLVDR
jgi:hypothetical protein